MTTKYKVKITRTAEHDIKHIWDYIAQDNNETAIRFIADVENKIKRLKNYPKRCPIIQESELLGIEYRHLIIGKYRVIFKIRGDVVYIMRIIHSTRLLDISIF